MNNQEFFDQINKHSLAKEHKTLVNLYDNALANKDSFEVGDDMSNILFFSYLPVKWYAMTMLGLQEEINREMVQLMPPNETNEKFLYGITMVMQSQDLKDYLELMERACTQPNRLLITARCRWAMQKKDLLARLEALADFDKTHYVFDTEKQVLIKAEINEYLTLNFTKDDMQSASVNNDLPKDNGFFNAEFEKDGYKASLNVPFPENNSICDEGHFFIEGNGVCKKWPIESYGVVNSCEASPYELCYKSTELTVIVKNIRLYPNNDKVV